VREREGRKSNGEKQRWEAQERERETQGQEGKKKR
jgi:hypothetical protein